MLAENFPKKKIIKKKIEYMNQNNNDTISRKLCLNYMYSFLLFCKCIQTYVEFGLRVLHYGYITEILRTVPAALHLQSQWKDDVLVFK